MRHETNRVDAMQAVSMELGLSLKQALVTCGEALPGPGGAAYLMNTKTRFEQMKQENVDCLDDSVPVSVLGLDSATVSTQTCCRKATWMLTPIIAPNES